MFKQPATSERIALSVPIRSALWSGIVTVMYIPAKARLQTDMANELPSVFVAKAPEQPDEIVTGKITRHSQVEMTSSFTV